VDGRVGNRWRGFTGELIGSNTSERLGITTTMEVQFPNHNGSRTPDGRWKNVRYDIGDGWYWFVGAAGE